ncbi:MAG: hypothetical protein HC822_04530 [Oscillochloris sp.]|nr:hypothetical protein [Oscillochloris sp.]
MLYNFGSEDVTVDLSALKFRSTGKRFYNFTSKDVSLDHGLFTTPDYAFRIDKDIPAGTEMLQVAVTKLYEQFDPDADLLPPYSNWRVHLQNWTDLDGDGEYWVDANGNGKVDATGEMETGEHNRFSYGYNTGPTQQVRIADPLERIDDGLLLTFRHRDRLNSVPTTDLRVEATFWQRQPWLWATLSSDSLTIPAGSAATFSATVKVPRNVPPGMYDGEIMVTQDGRDQVIPVTVAVAASGTNFTMGIPIAKNNPYDNSRFMGYTDYSWRAESGDWRFFLTDVAAKDLPAEGSPYLVVDNRWSSDGTDIDTIILGPEVDFIPDNLGGGQFPEATYGPYTLAEKGRSANTYVGSGRWVYQTSSGGPREIVAAPLTEGLHSIMFHQVRVDGYRWNEPYRANSGMVTLTPGAVEGSGATGNARFRINTSLALPGLEVKGYGFSAPETRTGTVNQDDPNDPSTASYMTTFDIQNGARLAVSTGGAADSDLDLYVYDPDGNLVGASTTPTDVENIVVSFPEDGTYTIAVHGWNVPTGSTEFELTIDAVQGDDIQASAVHGSLPAGGGTSINVSWDLSGRSAGTYGGLVLLGPRNAPGLFAVPVTIVVE